MHLGAANAVRGKSDGIVLRSRKRKCAEDPIEGYFGAANEVRGKTELIDTRQRSGKAENGLYGPRRSRRD